MLCFRIFLNVSKGMIRHCTRP